jgi:hypothetical protein
MLEGGWEKSTGCMGFVVFRIDDRAIVSKVLLDQIRDPEFLLDPQGHGLDKRPHAQRGVGEVGFQEPFKLDERFVVKSHIVKLIPGDSRLFQTGFYGQFREAMVVFLAGETLFLDSIYDFAIPDDARSAVVIIC